MAQFDDIWSRIDRMWVCPYCAYEISPETVQSRCERCKRPLFVERLFRAKPSTNFYIYLIVFFGLAQLLLVQAIFDILSEAEVVFILTHAAWVPIIFGITPFLFARRQWAFFASVFVFIVVGIQYAFFYIAPTFVTLEGVEQGTPLAGLYEGAYSMVGSTFIWLIWASVAIGLILATFFIGFDFTRRKDHILATVPVDLFRQSAATAHLSAVRFAEDQRWAQAVIYWRRAIAADPGRLLFYLHLGDAYRRLGFYERSLDTLNAAEERAKTEQGRLKVAELRAKVPIES